MCSRDLSHEVEPGVVYFAGETTRDSDEEATMHNKNKFTQTQTTIILEKNTFTQLLLVLLLVLLTACAEVTTSRNRDDVQVHRDASYGKLWAPLDPTYRNTLYIRDKKYYLADYKQKVSEIVASEDLKAVAVRFGEVQSDSPWKLIFVHEHRWWLCAWPNTQSPRADNFPSWEELAVSEFYKHHSVQSPNSRRRGALAMGEAMGDEVLTRFLEATATADFDKGASTRAHRPDYWVFSFQERLPQETQNTLRAKLLTKLRHTPNPKLLSRLVLIAAPSELTGVLGQELRQMLLSIDITELHPIAHEKLNSNTTTPTE